MPTMRLEGDTAPTAAATAPVPEPTSRTESPLCTPANCTKGSASLRLHLPMNRSYASPAENMRDFTDHRAKRVEKEWVPDMSTGRMTVLVVGATGSIGRHDLDALFAQLDADPPG